MSNPLKWLLVPVAAGLLVAGCGSDSDDGSDTSAADTTAADISASGPRGVVRAQGLALLFGSVLRTWINDEDPGLARTMAALDRALARGQRWSGLLDDLLLVPGAVWGGRPRRRRDAEDEDTVAV